MGVQLMLSEATILREARDKLGLTQQQVADRARIQIRQYQRFESGERNLTSSSFNIGCSVLEALEIDIAGFRRGDYVLSEEYENMDELREKRLKGEPTMKRKTVEPDKDLRLCLRQMPDDMKQRVIAYVESELGMTIPEYKARQIAAGYELVADIT